MVHAITNDEVLAAPRFIGRAADVMRALGERGAIHLRTRRLTAARLLEIARAMTPGAERSGCRLVINHHPEVAREAAAWGVQLTSRSLPPAVVRQETPWLRIGVSVHSPHEAGEVRSVADWVIAGHVFHTPSHPGEEPRGTALLTDVARAIGDDRGVLLVAIGGVVPERIAEVYAAGAGGVGAIGGIWSASDAGSAASDYLSAHDHAKDHA